MRILFIGDVFADIGRRVLAEKLAPLIDELKIDCCIANGENTAGGRGCTGNLVKKLRKYGVNIITGGNHSFTVPDNDASFMDEPYVLRPINYPPGNIGHGSALITLENGKTVGVVNLQGRTFHHESLDCPFRTGKAAIEELRTTTKVIIVDFHAEATSEKLAFATYIDGLASDVLGTHTHVQTADERILKGGTAFITDAGMTGPEESIIGMNAEQIVRHFLYQTHTRFEPSSKGAMLNAVVIEVEEESGKSCCITRIFERISFQ
ncbi:MAG: TIGR00282 family metallophosphoesterase [Chitinispirillaceae bacterium]|jgi:metallophosphoesterase (TIGR00282 family)